jgi:hypothetical protein
MAVGAISVLRLNLGILWSCQEKGALTFGALEKARRLPMRSSYHRAGVVSLVRLNAGFEEGKREQAALTPRS